MCRDEVSKAKGKLELNLTRYTKNNRKGFYTYVKQKRKVKEGVNPLINNADKLVTTEEEKAGAFFFASVFNNNLFPCFWSGWTVG